MQLCAGCVGSVANVGFACATLHTPGAVWISSTESFTNPFTAVGANCSNGSSTVTGW